MSLLWRDKLYIALRPDRIEVMHLAKGLRPKILESVELPCAPEVNQPLWSAPLETLKRQLQIIDAKCDVTIILTNHFLRYISVPWSDALVNDSERLTFARVRFENVYGDLARHWAVQVSQAGYGQSCIASAVDQVLIDHLQSACAAQDIQLNSIQPWLMSSINRYRHQLKGRDFRLLIAEPGQLCIIQHHANGNMEIKSQMLRASLEEELDLLLEREAAVAESGVPHRPYLIATGFLPFEITPAITRKFNLLESSKQKQALDSQSGKNGLLAMCGILQ